MSNARNIGLGARWLIVRRPAFAMLVMPVPSGRSTGNVPKAICCRFRMSQKIIRQKIFGQQHM